MKAIMRCLTMLFLLAAFYNSCSIPNPDYIRTERAVLILNTLAESLSVLDADSLAADSPRIDQDIRLTGRQPNAIIQHAGWLLVANSGQNSIDLHDPLTLEQYRSIYLGDNKNPYAIIPDPESSEIWVSNWLASSVTRIDLRDFSTQEILLYPEPENTVSGNPVTLQNGAITNGKLYICNTGFNGNNFEEGSILVIDLESREHIKTIPTGSGSNPQTILVFDDLEEIHVFLSYNNFEDDGRILIIDTASDTETTRLFIGGSPLTHRQAIDNNNQRVYLGGSAGIMVYNYQERTVLHGSDNFLYGSGEYDQLYAAPVLIPGPEPDSWYLVSTAFNANQIIILEVSDTLEIVNEKEIPASDGPLLVYYLAE